MDKTEKLLQEIFKTSLKIHLKYDVCVWVDIAGHVNQIRVEMAVDEDRYNQKVYHSNIYFDYPESLSHLETELSILKTILRTGQLKDIPTSFERGFTPHIANKLKTKVRTF